MMSAALPSDCLHLGRGLARDKHGRYQALRHWYAAGLAVLALLATAFMVGRSRPSGLQWFPTGISGLRRAGGQAASQACSDSTCAAYGDLILQLYQPLGYQLCAAGQALNPHSWLFLERRVDCTPLLAKVLESTTPTWPPPEEVPAEHLEEYTLGHRVNVITHYFKQQYNGAARSYQWDVPLVEGMIASARAKEPFGNYGSSTASLYHALAAHSVKGQEGLVIGSETPWVESICLAYGARGITTMEYHPINATHPQLKALHPSELVRRFLDGQGDVYDFAVSFSSLEHSGLGRYGDPMNPWGDVEEVARASCLVKPDGLLFLAVPMGHDVLAWNAHRIYGKLRTPLMIHNWQVLGAYQPTGAVADFEGEIWSFGSPVSNDYWNQPALVLRNKRGMRCGAARTAPAHNH